MTTGNGNGKANEPTTITVPQAGDAITKGFGETSIQRQAETSSTALAAQATAAVQARYVIALQRPRDWELVRVALLKACKRPLFAEDAIYAKPMGGETIQGPSIRFAEEAARAMTNVLTEVCAIYDDARKRIVRVTSTDLEANLTFYKDVTVEKVVERKHPKKGVTILGQRVNSYGDPVFLVSATEDEVATKEAAICSKVLREQLLRLMPSDIKEDAFATIRETRRKADAENPDAAKRKVIDGFFDLGVDPRALTEFVGHDLAALNPAELQRLRLIFAGLKDGETTWAEVMAQKRETAPPPAPAKPAETGAAAQSPAAAAAPAPAAAPPAKKGQANLGDVAASSRARRQNAQATAAGNSGPPEIGTDDRGDDPMLSDPAWQPGDTK